MDKKYSEVNVVIGEKQELTEEQQNCDVLCVTMFKDEKDKKIADLETKLKESEKLKDDAMYNFALLNQDLSDTKEKLIIERRAYNILHGNYSTLTSAYDQLKQQLAEKDAEVQSWKDGTIVVKLGKLEEQLAEMTEKYNACQEARKLESEFSQQDKKELIQQLAEKDGELHQIYSHLGVEAFGEDIHEQALKEIANRENQYNQLIFKSKYTSEEMIDFAVEQLKFLRNEIEIMGHIPNYTVLPERELICRYDVFRFIDQQINELKGEK